jgi:hypothetical protein
MDNPAPLSDGRETIQGANFLAMQAGVAALHEHERDLPARKVIAARDGKSVVVLLADLSEPAGPRRSLGVRLDPNVELSSQEVQSLLADLEKLEVLDTLQGQNYLAAYTAALAFQRKREADLTQYQIKVVRERGSLVVIFVDKDRKPGMRGGGGRIPGFEVNLDPKDLQVLKAHFLR